MRRSLRLRSAASTGDLRRGGQEYIYTMYTGPSQRMHGEGLQSRCRRGAGGQEDTTRTRAPGEIPPGRQSAGVTAPAPILGRGKCGGEGTMHHTENAAYRPPLGPQKHTPIGHVTALPSTTDGS